MGHRSPGYCGAGDHRRRSCGRDDRLPRLAGRTIARCWVDARGGLYIDAGYSSHGVMTRAAGSRVVVDAITGKLNPKQNPFRPDRKFQQRELDRL